MAKLKIIYKPIAELIHPDYNPRQISEADFEQLKKSLLTFEAVEPAVINTFEGRKNIIIGGNQRIRAAECLKWKEFPCVEVCLEEAKEKELNIRLNRGGEWDFDILANNFEVQDLLDFGFHKKELSFEVENKEREVSFITSTKICPHCGKEI